MIAVALHPLGYVLLPKAQEVSPAACELGVPFIIQLVDHQDAILVAQAQQVLAVRIMGCTNMVEAKALHSEYLLLDGTRIGCCTKGSQGVMIGITLEQHFLSVEQESVLGRQFYGTHAEVLTCFVSHSSFLVVERHLGDIEIRMVARPQLGPLQRDGWQFIFAVAPLGIERHVGFLLRHYSACHVEDFHLYRH